MPRLHSTATLRAQWNKATGDSKGPSVKEQLLAQQHKRAHLVIEWLRANWDGEVIVLPLCTSMLNGRGHWSTREEVKNQYLSHCELMQMARPRIMPPAPKELPEVWHVIVTYYGAAETDYDNAVSYMKWPCDFLKGRWCIDDKPKHLQVVRFDNLVDVRCPRLEFRTVE